MSCCLLSKYGRPPGEWPASGMLSAVWLVLILALVSRDVAAIEADKVPESKRTAAGLYLTARESAKLKQDGGAAVFFIDVRSRAEATFLGMPTLADVLIPFQEFNGDTAPWNDKAATFGMDANLDFVKQVDAEMARRGLAKNTPIIVMCRSGGRSAASASLLTKYGYTQVYSMVDGYEGDATPAGAPNAGQRTLNGWRVEGLPWTYRLEKSKVGAN